MALDKQLVAVPFRQGVDTRSDPKQLAPGKLVTLENGVFSSPGRIKKRNGYAGLGSASATGGSSSKAGLFVLGDELLTTDGDQVRRYVASLGSYETLGSVQRVTGAVNAITRRYLNLDVGRVARVRANVNCHNGDVAYDPDTGRTCYCWIQSSTIPNGGTTAQDVVYVRVVDEVTGAILVENQCSGDNSVYARFQSKVTRLGSAFLVTWVERRAGVDAVIRSSEITSANAIGAATLVALTHLSFPTYDVYSFDAAGAAVYPTSLAAAETRAHIVFSAVDSGPQARLACVRYDAGVGVGTITYRNIASHVLCCSIGLRSWTRVGGAGSAFATLTHGLIYALDGDGVYGDAFDGIAAAFGTATKVSSDLPNNCVFTNPVLGSVGTKGADYAAYTMEGAGTLGSGSCVIFGSATGANVAPTMTGAGGQLRGCALGAKPIWYQNPEGREVLWVLCHTDTTAAQDCYLLVDNQQEIHSRVLHSEALVAEQVSSAASSYNFLTLPNSELVSATELRWRTMGMVSSSGFTAFDSVEWALDTSTWATGREVLAGSLHLGGGLLLAYDGRVMAEQNFHLFPTDLAVSKAAGALTYSYKACYEWTDATGAIHRSEPSVAYSLANVTAITGGATAAVVVAAPRLTSKERVQDLVRTAIYRSTATDNTVYYLVGYAVYASSDHTVDTVALTDGVTDAALVLNALLYTTGGVLANAQPNPCSMAVAHRGRLFTNDTTHPNDIWYSKPLVSGAPIEFSQLQKLTMEESGGAITGLASLDEKLVVFKANRVLYVTGAGPDATGNANDYELHPLADDVGCVNHRSIVGTPDGVMFKSARGIYLIDRSLTPVFVGADVEGYNALTITSAVLMPDDHQVRFAVLSAATSALVYDYLVKQWSVFTSMQASDAVVRDDEYTWLLPASSVVFQQGATYDDNGDDIVLKVTTGWINFAALNGYQRLYRMLILGDYASAHDLVVQLAYDYGSIAQTMTASPASAPYRWSAQPATQKCSAVQVTIYDDSTAEGLDLSALTFVVGVKRGAAKLPATSSAT